MKKSLVLSLITVGVLACGTAQAKHHRNPPNKPDPAPTAAVAAPHAATVPDSGTTLMLLAGAMLVLVALRRRLA